MMKTQLFFTVEMSKQGPKTVHIRSTPWAENRVAHSQQLSFAIISSISQLSASTKHVKTIASFTSHNRMIWAQQGLSPCYRSGNKLQTTGLFWSPGQQTQVRPKSTFYAFLRVLPAMTTRPVGISRTGVGLVSNDGDMTCLAGGSEKQKWAKGLSDTQPLSASRRQMVMS